MIRYANIDFTGIKLQKSNMMQVNIGDNLQFMAIDYLYRCAGIPDSDVARIKLSEMKRGQENPAYVGDLLLMPMNWSIWEKEYMTESNLDVSEQVRIIPLGMCIAGHDDSSFYNDDNVAYYNSIAPLGCRDEYSMHKMQEQGVPSYLNGCLTSLFPRLENGFNVDGKVFFIDAPEELRPYVPERLLQDAVFMSQQYYLPADMSREAINEEIRSHYARLKSDARLVVTSRLHVASPCLAWGIPVIFAKKVIDHRFGWLDKYLPLYGEQDYGKIDWEPQPVDYEDGKQKLLAFNIKRITDTYDLYSTMDEITEYYGNLTGRDNYPSFRNTVAYDNGAVYDWLAKRFSAQDKFSYSLWGISGAADDVCEKIGELFPHAKLVAAVDRYKQAEFHGLEIQKPEVLQDLTELLVIVLPVKACSEARACFQNWGWDRERYFLRGDLYMEA